MNLPLNEWDDQVFFFSLRRYSLCLICSNPKVDVLPCHQPQLRKILYLKQTSESGATISSWHREDCKLTVHNPDLCHLNHCYSHWSILDRINSQQYGWRRQIWNLEHLRGWEETTEKQFCFLNGNFHLFPQSHQTLQCGKERGPRMFVPLLLWRLLEILLCQGLSMDNCLKWNKRETAAVNKAVCGFCAFSPPAWELR